MSPIPIPFFPRHPRAHLSAYLDGELGAAAARRLEHHLATCRACTSELDGLRETRAALRSLPEVPAPRSFALTPGMVRDAAPRARRGLQPLVAGLRATSAGLAVALAVTIVVAVSGGNSNNSAETAARNSEGYAAAAPTIAEMRRSDSGGLPLPSTGSLVAGGGNEPLATSFPGSAGVEPPDVAPSPAAGGVSAPNAASTPTPGLADQAGSLDGGPEGQGAPATAAPGKDVFGGLPTATTAAQQAPVLARTGGSSGGGAGTATIVAIALGVLQIGRAHV